MASSTSQEYYDSLTAKYPALMACISQMLAHGKDMLITNNEGSNAYLIDPFKNALHVVFLAGDIKVYYRISYSDVSPLKITNVRSSGTDISEFLDKFFASDDQIVDVCISPAKTYAYPLRIDGNEEQRQRRQLHLSKQEVSIVPFDIPKVGNRYDFIASIRGARRMHLEANLPGNDIREYIILTLKSSMYGTDKWLFQYGTTITETTSVRTLGRFLWSDVKSIHDVKMDAPYKPGYPVPEESLKTILETFFVGV